MSGTWRQTTAGATALAVAMLTALAVPTAAPAAEAAAQDMARPVAIYDMSEAADGTTLVDTSGIGMNGLIGADVITGLTDGTITYASFPHVPPSTPPTHPGHLDIVPHSPLLNPDDDDFAVTVRYRTTRTYGNIVQKGQNQTPGGYFKMEAAGGIATCLFKHSDGVQRAVSSGRALNDGAWHEVKCIRTSGAVSMWVDGVIAETREGVTGSVANNKDLTIGGKPDCDQINVSCDYFTGDIDLVELDKGPMTPVDSSPPTTPLPTLVPLIPARVFDTRPGESPSALRTITPGRLTPGTPLEVQLTDLAGIPATNVGAVSLNVAVNNPTTAGYITVYPCGNRPLVANLNYAAGQTTSNAVIAPISPTGTVCFYASTTTDLITDINGWFPTASGYGPIAPARVFDTRPGESPSALRTITPGRLTPGTPLEVQLTDLAGIPATNVGAVSLNVAVNNPTTAGYITVYPCGNRPLVANLNYAAGQTTSNAVIAPISPTGTVCFYASTTTDLITDINGWFALPSRS